MYLNVDYIMGVAYIKIISSVKRKFTLMIIIGLDQNKEVIGEKSNQHSVAAMGMKGRGG